MANLFLMRRQWRFTGVLSAAVLAVVALIGLPVAAYSVPSGCLDENNDPWGDNYNEDTTAVPYIIYGTRGNDQIDCSAASEAVYIKGGLGDDILIGSNCCSDTIEGGLGGDSLSGASGINDDDGEEDLCTGGPGNDTIDYSTCENDVVGSNDGPQPGPDGPNRNPPGQP